MSFRTRLFLLLSVAIAGCSESSPPDPAALETLPRPAKIVTAAPIGAVAPHTFPGTVRASRESELAFRVGGELVELPAQPGMRVKANQVLARLDDTDLRNTLADREAKYELALAQHGRTKKLLAQKHTTQAGLDEATANLKAAKAALDLARDTLGYATLRAPFDGVVASVAVENHQAMEARTTVLRLQDDATLDVVFNVPESLMARVQPGAHAYTSCGSVRFHARPDNTYRACYKEHDAVPDAQSGTYQVVYAMPRVEAFPVLPGMVVDVSLSLSALPSSPPRTSVVVPVEAVFDAEGRHWVWRVDEAMQVEPVAVEVGTVRGAGLEVLAGLSPGDRVVAAGLSHLRAGQKVTPFVKERGL